MPKLLGLNLLGVVAASIAFFFVGFIVYGILFTDIWTTANGVDLWLNANNMTAEEFAKTESPLWMVGGFLITVMQVIGLGKVLQWRGVNSVGEAAVTAGILWLFFALPLMHYAYLYLPAHSAPALMVDGAHLFVGWIVSAVILQLIR